MAAFAVITEAFVVYGQTTLGVSFINLNAYLATPVDSGIVFNAALPDPNITVVATTLVVTFPGPIATTADGIHIADATGFFSTVNIQSTDLSGGVIRIALPAGLTGSVATTFRLAGFRLPSCGRITLALDSLNNGYVLAQSQFGPFEPAASITSAHYSNGNIQIYGTNLDACSSPRVVLGEAELTGIASLSGGRGVSAVLPANTAPGTYRLVVVRNLGPLVFSLSIGVPGLSAPEVVSIPRTLEEKSAFSISGACPPNKKILSGGLAFASQQSFATLNRIEILGSSPSPPNSWTVTGINQNPADIPVLIRTVCGSGD